MKVLFVKFRHENGMITCNSAISLLVFYVHVGEIWNWSTLPTVSWELTSGPPEQQTLTVEPSLQLLLATFILHILEGLIPLKLFCVFFLLNILQTFSYTNH